jgi:hypothetical protein
MKWSPVGMYLAIGVACGDLVLLKYQKKRTATITVPEAHKNGIHALEWAPVSCCLGGEVILATGKFSI